MATIGGIYRTKEGCILHNSNDPYQVGSGVRYPLPGGVIYVYRGIGSALSIAVGRVEIESLNLLFRAILIINDSLIT
jgi:hypothetical protein